MSTGYDSTGGMTTLPPIQFVSQALQYGILNGRVVNRHKNAGLGVCPCVGRESRCVRWIPASDSQDNGRVHRSDKTLMTSSARGKINAVRPREIDLREIEPCSLVSQADFGGLGIEGPGESEIGGVTTSRRCLYKAETWSLVVTLVGTEGVSVFIDTYMNETGAVPTEIAPTAGFPAIMVTLPDGSASHNCWVMVDVAHSQHVEAWANNLARKEPPTREPCGYARQLAESAMRTLVGQQALTTTVAHDLAHAPPGWTRGGLRGGYPLTDEAPPRCCRWCGLRIEPTSGSSGQM